MAQRIIQLLPCPEEVRIAYRNPDTRGVDLYPATCIALIEKGATQGVVYLETVNNEIKEVDIDAPDFLGIIMAGDFEKIKDLETLVEQKTDAEQKF